MSDALIKDRGDRVERFRDHEDLVIGTWVWVYDGEPDKKGEVEGWLGCVTHARELPQVGIDVACR